MHTRTYTRRKCKRAGFVTHPHIYSSCLVILYNLMKIIFEFHKDLSIEFSRYLLNKSKFNANLSVFSTLVWRKIRHLVPQRLLLKRLRSVTVELSMAQSHILSVYIRGGVTKKNGKIWPTCALCYQLTGQTVHTVIKKPFHLCTLLSSNWTTCANCY